MASSSAASSAAPTSTSVVRPVVDVDAATAMVAAVATRPVDNPARRSSTDCANMARGRTGTRAFSVVPVEI